MPSYYSNVQYKSDCIIKYIDILLEGAKKNNNKRDSISFKKKKIDSFVHIGCSTLFWLVETAKQNFGLSHRTTKEKHSDELVQGQQA